MRAEVNKIKLQNGAITLDEWRSQDELTPLPNGQGKVHFMPLNVGTVAGITGLQGDIDADGVAVDGTSGADLTPETTPEDQEASELLKRVGGITGMLELFTQRDEEIISGETLVELLILFYRIERSEAEKIVKTLPKIKEKPDPIAVPDTFGNQDDSERQAKLLDAIEAVKREMKPMAEDSFRRDETLIAMRKGMDDVINLMIAKEADAAKRFAKSPSDYIKKLDEFYATHDDRFKRSIAWWVKAYALAADIEDKDLAGEMIRRSHEQSYNLLIEACECDQDKLVESVTKCVGSHEFKTRNLISKGE